MSISLVMNGTTYTIPQVGNRGWGTNVTSFFTGIANGTLQKTGGNFTLTGNVNFGPNYGLTALWLSARTTPIATAGFMRLGVTDTFGWRNNANSGNLLLGVNGSDQLTFNGSTFIAGAISSLTGDVTATGPGAAVATVVGVNSVLTTATGTQLNLIALATGTTGTNTGNIVFAASPTITGVLTFPTPFTLGATSVTTTGTQLNYLNQATGSTGTQGTNVVFSSSPTLLTPTFTTSATTAKVIGGTGTGSTLSLQSTSGTGGTSDLIKFLVGNNGATEAMRINANGTVGIGMTAVRTLDVTGTFGATGAAVLGSTLAVSGVTTLSRSASSGVTLDLNGVSVSNPASQAIRIIANTGGGYGGGIAAGLDGSGNEILYLQTWNAGSATNQLTIDHSGVSTFGGTVSATQYTSTIATGTAPLVVASTTLVPNLYVARAVLADSASVSGNLTGPITSVGNATSIASQTGTGTTFAMSVSPTFTGTPVLPTPFTIGAVSMTATGTQLNYLAAATGTTGTTSTNIVFSASPTFTGTVTHPTPFTLGAVSVTTTGTQLNYLSAATGTTGTTSTNVVFSTSPTLVTPVLGVATATSINKMAITAPATSSTLAVADGKTFTVSNTLTLTATDSSTLAIGAGGTLGSNAYTSTAYAPLASPTFTGTVTVPTPFTIGAVSMTATGTQLNYLAAATGTTGTTSTNIVFSTSPTLVTPIIGTPQSGTLTSCTGLPLTTGVTGTLPIANGGTAVTSVTTSPTASSFAGWDANKNLASNSFISGFTTTATAAGTTTMTIASTQINEWTGSTTQTVKLPTTGVIAGAQYLIINNSSGILTVQSSGANTIQALAASSQGVFTSVVATPTTAANWDVTYTAENGGTVTSVSVTTANGVSGSVATATTTPAITLTLAAITPTTIAGSDATDSTTSTTGAFKTAGGLGVAKAVNIGTTLTVTGVTTHTGAVTVTGGIVGTATNNNATAGNVGEYVSAYANFVNAPGLTTVWGDLTSISLTAGDWDVSMIAQNSYNAAVITTADIGIGTASGATTTGLVRGDTQTNIGIAPTASQDTSACIPAVRISLSGTSTIYAKCKMTYTGTPQIASRISARRVR